LGRLWNNIYLDPFETDVLRVIGGFLNQCLNLCVDDRIWYRMRHASLDFPVDDFPFSRIQRLVIDAAPHSGRKHLAK